MYLHLSVSFVSLTLWLYFLQKELCIHHMRNFLIEKENDILDHQLDLGCLMQMKKVNINLISYL